MTITQKILLFISIFGTCFGHISAQELTLKIDTQIKANQHVIDELGYTKTFVNRSLLEAEIERIQKQLYNIGYINLQLLSKTVDKFQFNAILKLGRRYDNIDIFGGTDYFVTLGFSPQIEPNTNLTFVRVSMERLAYTLEQFSKFSPKTFFCILVIKYI